MSDASASSDDEFVRARTATFALDDGTEVTVRPATPADREHLIAGFHQLSPRSVLTRFLRPIRELSEREVEHLLSVDYEDHFAWGAFDENGRGVGVARYFRDPERPDHAEAAVTIVDEYQGRGLGRLLLRLLAESALANGIRHFVAYVASENPALAEALQRAGARPIRHDDYGTELVIDLPAPNDFVDSQLAATLRAAARPDEE